MQTKLEDPTLQMAYEKLRVYTALGNRLRLSAFFVIAKNPGLSFNQIRKKLKVEKGLLAYHLAVLKAGGLVSFTYARKGRETSSYQLTDMGKNMYTELSERLNEPKTD